MNEEDLRVCWEAIRPRWTERIAPKTPREYWIFTDDVTLWLFDITDWPEEEKSTVRASHGKTSYTSPHREDPEGYWPEEAAFRKLCYQIHFEEEDRPSLFNNSCLQCDAPPAHLNGVTYYSEMADPYDTLRRTESR